MKKLLLASVLAIASFPSHAQTPDAKSGADVYCRSLKLETDEAYQSCLLHPELWTLEPNSSPYSEKDYIWDCVSYRWKWEEAKYYKTLADACVMRSCRGNHVALCANGNWGYVPRKLRELGRVPNAKYVKANSK